MAYLRYIGRDYTAGNVTPSSNVAVSLGQPQKRWKELYVDANSLHLGNVSLSIGKTGEVEFMKTNKLGQPVTSVDVANAHASIDAGGVLSFYSANTTGNVSLGRGLAVGYVGEKIPGANLDVNGNVHISGATTIGGVMTRVPQVGIGSTLANPDTALHIKDNDATLTLQRIGDTNTPGIDFQSNGGDVRAKIYMDGTNGTNKDIVFQNMLSTMEERFRVTRSGANVTGNLSVSRGIAVGYTDGRVPQANLEVKGNAHITGATTIAGALTLGTDLAVAQGGTGASSLADGYVLLGSGTSAITALNVTAKGSILAGDGSTDPVALAVGDDDQVLTADSGEASGLKWAAGGGSVADRSITQAKLAENSVGGSKVRANVLTGGQIIGSVVGFQSNVTGNLSVSRSMAVGYTDGRVPQANLDVKGNVYITGITTHASYSHFPDDVKVLWGHDPTGVVSDLEMYHGGTHSFIKNKTGDLRIKSDSLLLKNQADDETYLDANNGGSVDLYFDNTKKLETTGTGVSISGLGANVTGNVSVTRSMSIGYTDGKVPAANLDVNGTVAISDGTVALPSLINLGDVNTGIWFPAADTIATSVGGREAIRISGSARGGHIDSNITINSNVVNHKGLAVANYTEYANNIVNAGSSFTVSTGTNMARYTLNASHCEITLPAGQPRQPGTAKTIVLYLKQDATGGRTVDFNAPAGEALEWNNSASEPEVVSGANKVSIYTFMKFHGDTNWYCSQSFIEN